MTNGILLIEQKRNDIDSSQQSHRLVGEVCKNLASGRSFVQGRREATFGIEAHGHGQLLIAWKLERQQHWHCKIRKIINLEINLEICRHPKAALEHWCLLSSIILHIYIFDIYVCSFLSLNVLHQKFSILGNEKCQLLEKCETRMRMLVKTIRPSNWDIIKSHLSPGVNTCLARG